MNDLAAATSSHCLSTQTKNYWPHASDSFLFSLLLRITETQCDGVITRARPSSNNIFAHWCETFTTTICSICFSFWNFEIKTPKWRINQKSQYAPVSLTAIYMPYYILPATMFAHYDRDMTQSSSICTVMFVMYWDSQYYETCNICFHWYIQLWFTNMIHSHFQPCSVAHSSFIDSSTMTQYNETSHMFDPGCGI